MVFSSEIFLFGFLPIALLLYFISPAVLRNFTLTAVSYVFYGRRSPAYLVLILWSTLVDYCCGNLISGYWFSAGPPGEKPRASAFQRRFFVGVSLCSNLGLLLGFKYLTFAQRNINTVLLAMGKQPYELLNLALPVGISFYTFESISYTLDIFHGRAKPALAWTLERDTAPTFISRVAAELRALCSFACYITQFPHLVAGPIIRYQDLEEQLHHRTHSLTKFSRGVFFLSFGLGKKVLLANPAGSIADLAFTVKGLDPLCAWFGLLAYAMQIYFDFSGYSDMAIGLGLMVGFKFSKNFDSPYKAQSITDFWRRWHISLSNWLRDYLYIPLGGSRGSSARTYMNLMIVMLLGGLWHGAAWNFVIWGAIHGGWLCLERLLQRRSLYANAPAALRVAVTFAIVCLAWVFFRAHDLEKAFDYLKTLAGLQPTLPNAMLTHAIFWSPFNMVIMGIATATAFFGVQTWDLALNLSFSRAVAAAVLFGISVSAICGQSYNPFLYFKF